MKFRFLKQYTDTLACICGLMLFSALSFSLSAQSVPRAVEDGGVVVGAERTDLLHPLLQDRRVALVGNTTSVVGEEHEHLLDNLLRHGVKVVKVLGPEHGFRNNADAGAVVKDDRDVKTGIPIISLYGKHKKPTRQTLSDVDVVVFDMQDVGTRFFTYISTLHYVMEACAEQGKKLIVTDRPNPNDYVDGPMLEEDCRSFVGVDRLPILHGLTMGELALMINGERWLAKKSDECDLAIIPMLGWVHGQPYSLPVKPSPNLPTDNAIAWYPSLCLFEATIMSVGRGTDFPFETLGYPSKKFGSFSFVPKPIRGMDSNPMYKGRRCYGIDLRNEEPPQGLSLNLLIRYYKKAHEQGLKLISRRQTFRILAGTRKLSKQLEWGWPEERIRASWQSDLKAFHQLRRQYLIYPEDYKRFGPLAD